MTAVPVMTAVAAIKRGIVVVMRAVVAAIGPMVAVIVIRAVTVAAVTMTAIMAVVAAAVATVAVMTVVARFRLSGHADTGGAECGNERERKQHALEHRFLSLDAKGVRRNGGNALGARREGLPA